MAQKEMKMISIEKMDEIMNDYFPAEETVDFHGEELTVQKRIPFALVCEMVKKVADSCFNEDGEYSPEVRDFAMKLCCVEAFTNVRLPENNVEHQYQIINRTDLWFRMLQVIDPYQMDEINNAIQDRIDARLDANRAAFEHDVNRMLDAVNDVGKQVSDLFNNVSTEDIQKLVAALGEHGVDEEKIVQAVVAEQNKAREAKTEEVTDGE